MTIAERVVRRIKELSPKPVRDDCLAADLKFANRQQANRLTG